MKIKRRIAAVLAAAALVTTGVLVSAPAAQALGTKYVKCTYYDTASGYSSSSNGGFTTNGGVCGTAKARLFYSIYPGSPTYYTGWYYSSSTAFVPNPGNTVLGGNHGVSDPAPVGEAARNFNT